MWGACGGVGLARCDGAYKAQKGFPRGKPFSLRDLQRFSRASAICASFQRHTSVVIPLPRHAPTQHDGAPKKEKANKADIEHAEGHHGHDGAQQGARAGGGGSRDTRRGWRDDRLRDGGADERVGMRRGAISRHGCAPHLGILDSHNDSPAGLAMSDVMMICDNRSSWRGNVVGIRSPKKWREPCPKPKRARLCQPPFLHEPPAPACRQPPDLEVPAPSRL